MEEASKKFNEEFDRIKVLRIITLSRGVACARSTFFTFPKQCEIEYCEYCLKASN